MSERTSNYCLVSDHSYNQGNSRYDLRILSAGTFVRPLELNYVPKHVIDDERWKAFDKTKEVFCYCRYGIVPIPRNLIRET